MSMRKIVNNPTNHKWLSSEWGDVGMKKMIAVFLLVGLMVSVMAFPVQAAFASGLYLFSDDDKHEYLGKLTSDEFDIEGIFNRFGNYGSEFSSSSIFNEYGTYGGAFSNYSPFNEYALNPPIIIEFNSGVAVGSKPLSCNTVVFNSVNPYGLEDRLKKLGI